MSKISNLIRLRCAFSRRAAAAALAVALFLGGCREHPAASLTPEEIGRRLRLAQDDPARRLEITWLGAPKTIGAREGSWIERMIEDEFNLVLRPIIFEWSGYHRRKPLMMAGGDVPDVFWVEDRIALAADARHGFALELPYDVLVRHAPDYVRLIQEAAPEAWLLSHHDGRNYGLPTVGAPLNARHPLPGVWRQDWLRTVGIHTLPETLAEMREALWKFRHEDPDRNGIQDTFGMSPIAGLSHASRIDESFGEVFGAFGVLAGNWMERDGALVWGGVLPETREALAELRRWYAEGLIFPDYLLIGDNPNERVYRFTRGVVGYLPTYAVYRTYDTRLSATLATVMPKLHPGSEIPPGPFPAGPRGHRGAPVTGESQNIMVLGRHLAFSPEKVVRILQLFNRLAADRDFFLAASFGRRGIHWDWTPEDGIHALEPFRSDPFHGAAELVSANPTLESPWRFFSPFGAPRRWVGELASTGEREFNRRHRDEAFGLRSPLPWPDVVPGSEKHYVKLRRLQESVFARIIQGEWELDRFDAFVEQWYESGGREYTAAANRTLQLKRKLTADLNQLLADTNAVSVSGRLAANDGVPGTGGQLTTARPQR